MLSWKIYIWPAQIAAKAAPPSSTNVHPEEVTSPRVSPHHPAALNETPLRHNLAARPDPSEGPGTINNSKPGRTTPSITRRDHLGAPNPNWDTAAQRNTPQNPHLRRMRGRWSGGRRSRNICTENKPLRIKTHHRSYNLEHTWSIQACHWQIPHRVAEYPSWEIMQGNQLQAPETHKENILLWRDESTNIQKNHRNRTSAIRHHRSTNINNHGYGWLNRYCSQY